MGGDGFPRTQNFYAIAQDRSGLIWVGTDNQGISVWNGSEWKQYNQENALLGERIFDIKVSPFNGDVAIATSGGLSIYSPVTKTWRHLTRADGLAEDQISSIAFAPQGEIWIAHPCGGVACSSPKNDYTEWRKHTTKWYWDANQRVRQPLDYYGEGLPSNLCNAITVLDDASVWVGTTSGLAVYRHPKKWLFTRGKDAPDKNKGLFGGDISRKVKVSVADNPNTPDMLPEDYITCLYPSDEGIWIGFRRKGVALMHAQTLKIAPFEAGKGPRLNEKTRESWVTCFVTLPNGQLYAGTYGAGFKRIYQGKKKELKPLSVNENLPHPEPPPIPTQEDLKKLIARLSPQQPAGKSLQSCFWFEDWATQGDWCERYGKSYGILCATNAPIDNTELRMDYQKAPNYGYFIAGVMGPHRKPDDDLRHWVHWINKPDNRNVLYNPERGTRTEAEWDDHGEDYPLTFDGPDVWAVVEVPTGRNLISLYFYNPNGHENSNGYRDYLIEIRKPIVDSHIKPSSYDQIWDHIRETIHYKDPFKTPVLARSRVKDFAGGGVYKNFIVEGGRFYLVRVCRNYSFNTILNGIFLSNLDETQNKIPQNRDPDFTYGTVWPAPPSIKHIDINDISPEAMNLWSLAASHTLKPEAIPASRLASLLAYRKAVADKAPDELLTTWRWYLKLWNSGDKDAIAEMLHQSWESQLESEPHNRSSEWSPHSPGTVPFSVEELNWMKQFHIDWKLYRSDSPVKPPMSVNEMKKHLKELNRQYWEKRKNTSSSL